MHYEHCVFKPAKQVKNSPRISTLFPTVPINAALAQKVKGSIKWPKPLKSYCQAVLADLIRS